MGTCMQGSLTNWEKLAGELAILAIATCEI